MSDSWTIARLSDVLSEISDRAGKQKLDVLSVTEKRGIIPQSDVFNRRIATEDISDYKVLEPLDLAFNPYLLWAGAIGQWMGETRGVVSPVYPCFRAKESENSRWLGLVFESAVLRPYFDSTAIGSIVRRRRTTIPVFLNAELQRPPRSVQNRIVDVISSVDSYITALQQQADAARVARSAVLSELLSAGGEDWTETTLGAHISIVMGQAPPGKDCNKDGIGVPFVKAGEFTDGFPLIREWTTNPLRFSKLGDTLICVVGATCGKLSRGIDCAIGRSVAALQPLETLDGGFLWTSMTRKVQEMREGSRGSAQGVITKDDLANLPLRLPPLVEQKRIVEIVSSIDEVIQSADRAITDAKSLRSGLLSELLSGAHEIPESYDRLLGAA